MSEATTTETVAVAEKRPKLFGKKVKAEAPAPKAKASGLESLNPGKPDRLRCDGDSKQHRI